MKKKNLIFYGIASLFLFAIFFQSCKDPCEKLNCLSNEICVDGVCVKVEDKCKGVNCFNDGICDNGDCICTNGYEGVDCSVESRTKFLGNWTLFDGCYSVTSSTTISLNSQSVQRVNISNLFGPTLGGNVYALVDGTTITIPSQTVYDNDGDLWIVEGLTTGNYTNTSFSINVNFKIYSQSDTCLYSFIKL